MQLRVFTLGLLSCLTFASCLSSSPQSSVDSCADFLGKPWVPEVPGLSLEGQPSSVVISKTEQLVQMPLNGTEDIPKEISIEIPMPDDLGPEGSLTLVAENVRMPVGFRGGAFPMLTSLSDGVHELVHLVQRNSSESASLDEGGCAHSEGLFCCSENSCQPNPRWIIAYPSAYQDRNQWEQHQINPFGHLSVSTFPTCNWSTGNPQCLFNDQSYFSISKLRFGQPYQAKYVLVSENHRKVPEVVSGEVKLTWLRKKTVKSGAGAVDLNLVLVGAKNIAASRDPKGQQNLNALIAHLDQRFSSNALGFKIGRVQVFEWDCRNGGDAYAEISIQNLGKLFSVGSRLLPVESETRALNLFLVSNLLGARPGLTILGASGGVGGPMISGTAASGLAFASFNKLEKFNPECGETECRTEFQEKQFLEIAETMAHEMGHFLGLNHLSESSGKRHDALPDTPKCTRTELLRSGAFITHRSCRQLDSEDIFPLTSRNCREACPSYDGRTEFCPQAVECPFNHLMWWTNKNFSRGNGDGSFVSEDSWKVIRYSPAIQ